MNRSWIVPWLGVLVVVAVLLPVDIPAQSQTPTQAYLAFVSAAPKASSLKELLPYLSEAYQAMLTAQPEGERALWLQRLKESVDMADIEVVSETIDGDTCTLKATAKNAQGIPLHGKVILVKEKGAWKLDEQFWAT